MRYSLIDADTQVTLTQVPVCYYSNAQGALHVAALMALRFARGGRSVVLMGAGKPRLYPAGPDAGPQVPCAECGTWMAPHPAEICSPCRERLSPRAGGSRRKRARGSARPKAASRDTSAQLRLPRM